MFTVSFREFSGIWFALALGDDERIVASSFSSRGKREVTSGILLSLPMGSSLSEAEPSGLAQRILSDMFRVYEGKPVEREFAIDMDRLSPFFRRVLTATSKIPRGFVFTYGRVAKASGNKGAARAVGRAEALNPFAPIVPCHRVVGSNLELQGYGGGLDVKRAILEREGVVFDKNRVSQSCLWIPRE